MQTEPQTVLGEGISPTQTQLMRGHTTRLNDVEIMQLTECYENRLLEPWRGFSQMKRRNPQPQEPKPATCGTADITAPGEPEVD